MHTLTRPFFFFFEKKNDYHYVGIMDTILSGSVPILTSLEQYEIQGSWIDWKQLSYYLPVHTYTSLYTEYRTKTSFHPNTTKEKFLSGLEKIVEDKEGYDRRHRAILENMKLFDYTTLYPFDVYMYLVQAHLFPESRHSKSRWSALLLPPVLFDQ